MKAPTATALGGLWTPWAEVLCFACHGPKWKRSGEPIGDFENQCKPRKACEQWPGIWEQAGVCDECSKPVWLSEDIAVEQAVVLAIRAMDIPGVTAGMQQTGGMCSAAGAFFSGMIVYITNSEDEDEDNGGLLLGLYASEDALGDGETIDMVDCYTPQEAAAKVKEWASIESEKIATKGRKDDALEYLNQLVADARQAWEEEHGSDSADGQLIWDDMNILLAELDPPSAPLVTCDCEDCPNPVAPAKDERRTNLCEDCDSHNCDGDGPCDRLAELVDPYTA